MKANSKLWQYTMIGASAVACRSLMFIASCQEAEQAEQGISEEVAYIRGLESWVYGYPIVVMDVTRQVMTAADSPGKDKESNWLPTPPGAFNISLRNYWPKEDAINGTYKNPPIKKVQ
jgi:hypothetical protein